VSIIFIFNQVLERRVSAFCEIVTLRYCVDKLLAILGGTLDTLVTR